MRSTRPVKKWRFKWPKNGLHRHRFWLLASTKSEAKSVKSSRPIGLTRERKELRIRTLTTTNHYDRQCRIDAGARNGMHLWRATFRDRRNSPKRSRGNF